MAEDLGNGREPAVHSEHAVGQDERQALRESIQQRDHAIDVAGSVVEALDARERRAGDETRVCIGVEQGQVMPATGEALEGGEVCEESIFQDQCGLRAHELREAALQSLVQLQVSGGAA